MSQLPQGPHSLSQSSQQPFFFSLPGHLHLSCCLSKLPQALPSHFGAFLMNSFRSLSPSSLHLPHSHSPHGCQSVTQADGVQHSFLHLSLSSLSEEHSLPHAFASFLTTRFRVLKPSSYWSSEHLASHELHGPHSSSQSTGFTASQPSLSVSCFGDYTDIMASKSP